MSKKTDLIPTTAHQKPQSTSAIAAMPASALPAQKSIEEVKHSIVERIKALAFKDGPRGIESFIADDIKWYPEKYLRNVEAALQHEEGDLALGVAEQITNGVVSTLVNDSIHFYWKTKSDDYWQTIAGVSALTHYAALSMHDDFSTADDRVQQQCMALMKFTRLIDTLPQEPSPFLDYVDDFRIDARIINDESLITLITNRPDDVERIAEVVIEHRTSNGPAINGILEGALHPVSEGYL